MNALDQLKTLSVAISEQLIVIGQRKWEVPESALNWRVVELKRVVENLRADIAAGERKAVPVLRAHADELKGALRVAFDIMEPAQFKKFEKKWAKHPANREEKP